MFFGGQSIVVSWIALENYELNGRRLHFVERLGVTSY